MELFVFINSLSHLIPNQNTFIGTFLKVQEKNITNSDLFIMKEEHLIAYLIKMWLSAYF